MNDLAKKKKYSHMITVGDNFYPNGIPFMWFRMLPWISMSQFKKSAIKHIPIYISVGNHDCYGNLNNSIKYSDYDSQYSLESDYYVLATQLEDDPSKYFINIMLNSCKLY